MGLKKFVKRNWIGGILGIPIMQIIREYLVTLAFAGFPNAFGLHDIGVAMTGIFTLEPFFIAVSVIGFFAGAWIQSKIFKK